MRADVSQIAADVAAAGGHGPTLAGRIRFKLEFAMLLVAVGRIDEAADAFSDAFDLLDQLDSRHRPAGRDHRTPGLAPGVFFCAPPIAARDPPARSPELDRRRRDPPPDVSAARPDRPGPRPGIRCPVAGIQRRPMSPGAPAYRVNPPSTGDRKSRPGRRAPGPDRPRAWAMFQTNNTSVFRIVPNCPILTLKVAYIFLQGPP